MWIFSRYGFYSVVCAREGKGWSAKVDENRLMVRGRSKKHLENLQERFPELKTCEMLITPHNDYRFRLFVDKKVWSKIMMELSEELNYDNFKDEAKHHLGDKEYEQCLGSVWSIMYRFQSDTEAEEKGSVSAWDVRAEEL